MWRRTRDTGVKANTEERRIIGVSSVFGEKRTDTNNHDSRLFAGHFSPIPTVF